MISQGCVVVNGKTATLGQSVDPQLDEILVEGRLLRPATRMRYIALHKPDGYVTSTVSEHGEPIVMDLLDVPERIYPVGRLDVDTAGLLLLTNDGEWANLVIHPRYEVEKEYIAMVRGHPTTHELERLRAGIRLRIGEVTSPASVDAVHRAETTTTLRIVVHEGKKRQIRLMMAAVAHPVLRLTRVRVGALRLGDLSPGIWRELTSAEVDGMRSVAGVRKRVSHE
jgi:23S rRNA pseudouridine2605 synthase